MKKLIALICLISLCSTMFGTIDDLYGTWQIDNIVYKFNSDSLYIDEVGNEGFGYTYNISHDTIYAYDSYRKDTIVFKLVDLNRYELILNCIQDTDTFTLINTEKMKEYYERKNQ